MTNNFDVDTIDEILQNAALEKDVVLSNAREGFFIIDKNLIIKPLYSLALLSIMQSPPPEGKSLSQFISKNLQKNNLNLLNEFIELVMDSSLDEYVLNDLNPLNKMEFKFLNDNEVFTSKYLTFSFNRIYQDHEIIGAFVSVTDHTTEYLLSQKLTETAEKSKKQIEWLMSIIQLDCTMLNEFITSFNDEMKFIESLLKTDQPQKYKSILDQISRSCHLVKGNAALLDLKYFANQAHHLEEVAVSIKNKHNIGGDDFLPVVFGIKDLKENIKDLKSLVDKLSNFKMQQPKKEISKEERIIRTLKDMVKKMSLEQDKKVEVNTAEFDMSVIPSQYILLLRNLLMQLGRYSMAFGIENVQEREAINKPDTAVIKLNTSIDNDYFILKYFDDGRGLQTEKLKQRAIEVGKSSAAEIGKWDKLKLADIIFETANSSSGFLERGVGINVVKNMVDKHNGMIEVDFEENKYCEFTISLPLPK